MSRPSARLSTGRGDDGLGQPTDRDLEVEHIEAADAVVRRQDRVVEQDGLPELLGRSESVTAVLEGKADAGVELGHVRIFEQGCGQDVLGLVRSPE